MNSFDLQNSRVLIIIPARFESTRLPGKIITDIGGKPMIRHVYERCLETHANAVYVATDNQQILNTVISFGGNCVITDHCENGTERVFKAVENIQGDYDIVINVQGDEPLIDPSHINMVINLVKMYPNVISTLVTSLRDGDLLNRNRVKVILNSYDTQSSKICMFTRSGCKRYPGIMRHVGIYGFHIDLLQKISKLKQTENERAESLEQLRWFDNGYDFVSSYVYSVAHGVDTQEDLDNIKAIFHKQKLN